MAENSKIEWTDHTFNPWIGCTKVGPPCDGCYAENLMATRYGRVEWGAPGKGVGTRLRTSTANWRKPFAWDKAAKASGKRTFVFCASLADIFDNQVPAEWRSDAFDVMRQTPNLTYLLLTKRPQLIVKLCEAAGGLPRNAAIGATMGDQFEYDRDRIKLAEAKIILNPVFSFGSFEPLLGPVILDKYAPDWIIVGGETDQGKHKARLANPEWMRALRDQTERLGRAFFLKQMTNKAPIPADLLLRQWPIAASGGWAVAQNIADAIRTPSPATSE
jgi:protein gp37